MANNNYDSFGGFMKHMGWKILLGLIAVVTIISSCYYIKPGYRGTLTTLGTVSQKSYTNGIGVKPPFISTMHETDVRTQVMSDTAITYTSDIQTATIAFTLTYNLNPDAVPYIYQHIGSDYETKLIIPYLQDAIKDVIGKWRAQVLVANRDNARLGILNLLKQKINSKYIRNISFQITDLDYSANFEHAIENKVIAEQKAQEAVNNTKRIQEEANQKVISAEADAKAMRIKAQALESNPKLIDYEKWTRWDGHMPKVVSGSGAMTLISAD